jgi:hypothetical protein
VASCTRARLRIHRGPRAYRPAVVAAAAVEGPLEIVGNIFSAQHGISQRDQVSGCGGGYVRLLDGGGEALGGSGIFALRIVSAIEVFPLVSYEFRRDKRNSCLMTEIPPVRGSATIFFRNALRRSSFAWIVSASVCFAATTAPMYFTKLIPHFSHFTPVRCLLPQEGHSNRMVMWQRWQKRATSRTAAPHFGQGIVACGANAAVGSHALAGLGDFRGEALARIAGGGASEFGGDAAGVPVLVSAFALAGSSLAGTRASNAALSGLPLPFPEAELPVIPHLSRDDGAISARP